MKKTILLILATLLTTLFSSCSDDDSIDSYIKLSETTLEVDNQKGEYLITVATNTHWEITNIPEWISTSQKSGSPSSEKQELTIYVAFNDTREDRESDINFVANNVTTKLKVKQSCIPDSEAFIELDKSMISFSELPLQTQEVKVTSNVSWKINNIPSWLTITPSSANGSQKITVKADENYHPLSKEVILEFESKGIITQLPIKQTGLRDIARSPSMQIFPYEELSGTWPSSIYKVKTIRYFINAENAKSAFVGSLISHNVPNYPILTPFSGYTYNPTYLSTSSLLVLPTEYTPSLTANKAYAQTIIDSNPQSILSFRTGSPESFYSYKDLHAMGMINIGIPLDELISGKSYKEQEMDYLYGIVYSYKKTVFDMIRDIPDNGKAVKENLKATDIAKGVSYISYMHYGQVGFLYIETNNDDREVKPIVQKVFKDESLTSTEASKLEASRFSYIYFNNDNEIQIKQGGSEIIEEYKKGMKDSKNIYPIEFYLSNYDTHGVQSLNYIYNLN